MTRPDQRRSARKDSTMSTAPFGRRGLLLGTGGLLASGVLAACSSEPAPPAAPPTGTPAEQPVPAQTTEQFARIIPEINETVLAADEARDADGLAPRVSGSAAEFRKAAYEMIEKAEEWAEQLRVPGTELIVPMTSVSAEFPRVAIALVEDSVEDGVPYFVALRQEKATAEYTTWGWAQQAVGVEMPTVPNAAVGAEPLDREAEGLLMAPAKALALYASVLSNGDSKDPDDLLAPNPFQTATHENIQGERSELNQGVEWDEAATIHERYSVDEDEFVGLRTEDGGAIVMATLRSTRRVKVKDGATMRYAEDNEYTKVIGTKEFTSEYVREYGTHVALHIPSKDAGGQVQPIAASQIAVGASGE
ncbi:hypothetical protein [Brachybacterium saurashtrense]|uniref:DUF8094 domain-containing protein n=1 Tax=Brachybacterium saurashtrense TaxID=556288 RepID=A0A345YN82_9MICO|nr:hypothetical protein [Brachybacterium saurashtrense]AXK45384.1 hypothetical protein DWV08_06970 [Brachybacterium saurashtrense]RRR21859.1 hypothetical protein DXU92_11100 [Brachybacterium saurashtrense]